MSKNHKPYIPASAPALDLSQVDATATQARAFFAQGLIREARELFKQLHRLDPAAYLAELVACYHAQADQLIATGREKEARNILDHAAALSKDSPLKAQTDSRLFAISAIAPDAQGTLPAAAAQTLILGAAGISLESRDRAADTLVTCFAPVPVLELADPVLHGELMAITSALRLVCASQYPEATGLLRCIGIDSPFSQWKLLVKGMIAFYTSDDEKALAAFSRIRPDTAPGKMARAYTALLDQSEQAPPLPDGEHQAYCKRLCDIAGFSRYSEAVSRADYLWKAGRHRDAYRHVCDTVNSFPRKGTDVTGLLTELFFIFPFSMPIKERIRYVDQLADTIIKSKHPSPVASFLGCHMEFLLAMEAEEDDRQLLSFARDFIELHRRVYGNDPRIQARVMGALGCIYAQMQREDPDFFPFGISEPMIRNTDLAVGCLQECMKLDTSDLKTPVILIDVFEKTKRKREANQLLNDLLERFPDNKDLLIRAVNNAKARSAPQKKIGFLERIMVIDPLDPVVKESLAVEYISAAKGNTPGRPSKKWEAWMERAEALSVEKSGNFNLGRSFQRVRSAAFFLMEGEREKSMDSLRVALAGSDEPAVVRYFALLYWKTFGVPDKEVSVLEHDVALEFKEKANPARAARYIDVLIYAETLGVRINSVEERKRCSFYALRSLEQGVPRPACRRMIEFAWKIQDPILARGVVRKVLERDKEDPLFLFFELTTELEKLKKKLHNGHTQEGKKVRNRLIAIRDIAQKRHDQEALSQILPVLQKMDHQPPEPPDHLPSGPIPPFPFDMSDMNPKELLDAIGEISKHYGGNMDAVMRDFAEMMGDAFPGPEPRGKRPRKRKSDDDLYF